MPTIQELIAQVRTGEIVLPEFQRGYVWNRDQVRKFVTALYRRHPTGHLLIWKTQKPSGIRGEAARAEGHTQLLIDGQQRLTSLFVLTERKPPSFYEGLKRINSAWKVVGARLPLRASLLRSLLQRTKRGVPLLSEVPHGGQPAMDQRPQLLQGRPQRLFGTTRQDARGRGDQPMSWVRRHDEYESK